LSKLLLLLVICQICWRSVKEFGRGDGSNFRLPHWFEYSRSLQHCRV